MLNKQMENLEKFLQTAIKTESSDPPQPAPYQIPQQQLQFPQPMAMPSFNQQPVMGVNPIGYGFQPQMMQQQQQLMPPQQQYLPQQFQSGQQNHS
jgi:hypothetical protein